MSFEQVAKSDDAKGRQPHTTHLASGVVSITSFATYQTPGGETWFQAQTNNTLINGPVTSLLAIEYR